MIFSKNLCGIDSGRIKEREGKKKIEKIILKNGLKIKVRLDKIFEKLFIRVIFDLLRWNSCYSRCQIK